MALRRVAVTNECGRRIFEGPTTDLPEKGDGRGIQYGAWWSVMSRGLLEGLAWFRRELHESCGGVPIHCSSWRTR
jgi:hypothetical protein